MLSLNLLQMQLGTSTNNIQTIREINTPIANLFALCRDAWRQWACDVIDRDSHLHFRIVRAMHACLMRNLAIIRVSSLNDMRAC